MSLELKDIELNFLYDKLDDMRIQRFSISSFNAYRDNPFIWYLRYIAKFKSRWPMQGFWRNDAIKSAIYRSIVTAEEPNKLLDYAVELYHAKVITHLLSLYKEIATSHSAEDIIAMMRDFTKEKFPFVLDNLVGLQFKLNNGLDLNDQPLPAFLVPDSSEYASYLKKIQKQYALIESCVLNGIKYFREVKDSSFGFHVRTQYQGFGLPVSVVEYSDLQFASNGYSIYISDSLPKSLEDKKTKDHQLKAAFMSLATGKPWRLVYLSKLKPGDIKTNQISQMFSNGMHPDEIAKTWKDGEGKGTTSKTVNAILQETLAPGYIPPQPMVVFDLPVESISELNLKNKFSGEAITRMIAACRKDNLEDDLKYFCLGNFEHMFLDPDQKAAIKKIWGFEAATETESEDTNE